MTAAVRNPELLTAADLEVLASVTYEVRALNDGTTHEPIGDPAGPGLWHRKGVQLPAYIQQVATALIRTGTSESRAIATAVSRCKVWCAGGQHVHPDTKAKACAAVAEWEKLKVQSHAESDKKSAAFVMAMWSADLHPRVPAGGPGGGRFAPGSTSGTPSNKQPVGQGESTGRVTDLQNRLNQLGFHLKVDGKFGPETLAAVRKFQQTHKDASGKPLKVDGLVGPLTTAALRLAGKQPAKTRTGKPRVVKPKVVKPGVTKSAAQATGLPQLVTIPGVDLVAAGSWELSSGRNTFTRADLQAAIEASQCPAVGTPVIKLGHVDPRWDGEPAIGHVANLRLNEAGTKLIGDLADMPGWLAAVSASAFPRRSIEGSYGFKCQIGHDHPFVLTGLALLGVTAPGVGVLNKLPDIASLYGLTASQAQELTGWTFVSDQLDQEGMPMAVTEEDVRRAYYANSGVPHTWWITELQMSPTQLIVAGDDGQILRVPFTIDGDEVGFGDAVPLASYADLAVARGTGRVVTYASAAESREVTGEAVDYDDDPDLTDDDAEDVEAAEGDKPYGDVRYADSKNGKYPIDTEAHARAAWSYINQDKNAAQYPMNGVSLQTVKDAIIAACKKFGIDVSDSEGKADQPGGDKKEASATDAPTLEGDMMTGDKNNAAMGHGPCTTTHSHPHPAYGAQGSDQTHSHSHSHSGDNNHAHTHAATNRKGGSDVEFTSEQETNLRNALGLGEDEELTPELITSAAATLKETKVAAGKRSLPPGVIQVSQEVWDNLNKKIEASTRFQAKVMRDERDEYIDKAIRDGKFSGASRTQWVRMWDADPDGTREVLATLKKNVVPVEDIGMAGGSLDDDAFESEFAGLYPPGTPGFSKGR